MKKLLIAGLLVLSAAWGAAPANAKDDFLTYQEADAIREAQDPAKRIVLYLDFAQDRLDAAREQTVAKDAKAGEAIQKNLSEYNSILQALDDSLEDARTKRSSLQKPLKEMEDQTTHFLKVLDQLENAPNRSDYQFTLDEAVDATKDELSQAKKGAFPEVKDRTPPTDLPAAPPPPAKKGGDDEGPPRKNSKSPSDAP